MTPSSGSVLRRLAVWVLAIYVVAAGIVLLAPISYGDIIHEVDGWVTTIPGMDFFGSGWIEFAANIALFLPMGFLFTVLTRRPWLGAMLGAVISAGVEVAQIWIPDRQPMLRDVLSNFVGAALGAVLAWVFVLRRERRAARATLTGAPPSATRRAG